MVWIPHASPAKVTTPTPGYVLDVGTVSDPNNPNILSVSSKSPINIPISYGRRAIFGVVIWSGNFKVTGAATGNFATYCDFAVAFGYPGTPSDELESVELSRIWIEEGTTLGAGGRLIYDRTTPGGYALSADLNITIYDGSETQVADLRIARTEGAASTPPFRGLIYVVFRHFNLTKYGLTTIPQLRAELVDITDPVNYYIPFDEDGINAKDKLTFNANPTNGMTVTIDGVVYTFRKGDADSAYEVHIGANIAGTIQNLINAVNATGLAGFSSYGVGTLVHPTVKGGIGLIARNFIATARTAGTAGNSIAVSTTINGAWNHPTLSGALSDSIGLPGFQPIGVDWKRNRVYFVTEEVSRCILRVYDLSTMREVVRGPIKNELGVNITEANLNSDFLWQVDESSGMIYTTFGGTTNNVPMLCINPNTQRVISRFGKSSTSFPLVNAAIPRLSFPTRMRFATITQGYGPCTGTARYAVCCTINTQLFLMALNANGTFPLAAVSPTSIHTYPSTITAFDLQESILVDVKAASEFGITSQDTVSNTVGIRAYVGAGNVLYETLWKTLAPYQETPSTRALVTFTPGSIIDRVVWGQENKELLVFHRTPLGVSKLRRYSWEGDGIAFDYVSGFLTSAGSFTQTYDVEVPQINLTTWELGWQYTKIEMGRYGYQADITGAHVAVVINTQTGAYKTYPMEEYVEYNTDFATNEEATATAFNFNGIGIESKGGQPYCPSGGYFIGRPNTASGSVTGGLMYVNGILNFRVLLSSLLRWLSLSAGYTADQIYISSNIDDRILGCIIEERTDIFSLIEALGIIFNFKYFESEEKIKFVRTPTGDSLDITANLTIDNIAPTSSGDRVVDSESFIAEMAPQSDTPDTMALTFIDFTNDYQPSTVSARKSRFPFTVEKDNNIASYSIPIIMLPSEALERVYKALYLSMAVRLKAQFRTGPEFLLTEPMDAVELNVNDVSYMMSIYEATINDDYSISMGAWTLATQDVNIETIEDDLTPVPVIVGSYLSETIIIDSSLISVGDDPNDTSTLVVYLMAYGYNNNWPGATIYYGLGGDNFAPVLNIINPEVVGHVTSELIDTGLEHFTDEDATIQVQLIDPLLSEALGSVTDDDLLTGGNRALIGHTGAWEMIQYRDVTDNGNGSLTLSAIIRGLRNTEHNMATHTIGDYFIPIRNSFVPLRHTINETFLGQSAFYTARNPNQQQILNVPQEFIINATSRKPWSPNDYSINFGGGAFTIAWARRTKDDAPLEDGTGEISLEFTSERFEIDIYDDHTEEVVTTISVAGAETYDYTDTTFFTDAFPHTEEAQTIINPGAETGTASWTTTSGSLGTISDEHSGTASFTNTIAPVLSHQDIAVPAGSYADVDAGNCKILVSWWQDSGSGDVAEATAAIDVDFYDGSPGSLISSSPGTQTHENSGDLSFVYRERIIAIPALTRTIRLAINFPHSSSTYVDDIGLDLWTLNTTPVTMTIAVYQLSDDPAIGRGEGRIKTVDISY